MNKMDNPVKKFEHGAGTGQNGDGDQRRLSWASA